MKNFMKALAACRLQLMACGLKLAAWGSNLFTINLNACSLKLAACCLKLAACSLRLVAGLGPRRLVWSLQLAMHSGAMLVFAVRYVRNSFIPTCPTI